MSLENRTLRLSDPAREYQRVRSEIDAAVSAVLKSGVYVRGREVMALEQEIAALCGVNHAVVTASGTMALIVSLKALGIGVGDEVITAPYTSICTTAAITHAGAAIRFADIEPQTLTLDPGQVARAISPRTRAIIAVHLHGLVADMDALWELAEAHNLALIEDAALALGATYRGRPVGGLGHAAAVSFAPSKILGGIGWGGIFVTDADEVVDRARQLAGFGRSQEMEGVEFELEGYNAQLSSIQAAALRVKLRYLPNWLERRRAIAAYYDGVFDRLGLRRLHPPSWTAPSYRAYVILTPGRDELLDHLRRQGIDASAHFTPALHLRPVYARLGYRRGDFPVAEQETEQLLCLPIHPHLSDGDVERITAAFQRMPSIAERL